MTPDDEQRGWNFPVPESALRLFVSPGGRNYVPNSSIGKLVANLREGPREREPERRGQGAARPRREGSVRGDRGRACRRRRGRPTCRPGR